MARRIHTIVVAAVSIVLGSRMGVQAAFAATTSGDPPPITFTSPSPQASANFGSSVAVSGGIEVIGAPHESVGTFGEAGRAYIFDAPTGTLIATLTSPNPQAFGHFGASVAVTTSSVPPVSGVLVGAPGESAGGFSGAGHAYFFSTTGTLSGTLTSPNAQVGGEFGMSVAVTVCFSNLCPAVGAPGESPGAVSSAGQAYFTTSGCPSACAFGGSLTSPNAQAGGNFGWSVAVSSTTVVVGAIFESPGGLSGAGHAYVFGSSITTLTSPNAQAGGNFGWSVAVSGSSVVVGAPGENPGGVIPPPGCTAMSTCAAGHAYLCTTTCPSSGTLTSPNAQLDGLFGTSVAVSGSSVVVGAPGESAGGFGGAGHAYLCTITCPSSRTLTSPNAQVGGEFGMSVADDDAPRRTTVMVGAPGETAGGFAAAGHAYLYVRLKT